MIVINVRLNRFISVDSLWPHPLHIPSIILLGIHSLTHSVATTIRLPTLFRGMPTSAVVTTRILTLRPTLTLSMPSPACVMILPLALILDVLSRWSTSIVTLTVLLLPLRPLILLLVPYIVSLILILPILTILTSNAPPLLSRPSSCETPICTSRPWGPSAMELTPTCHWL